PVAGRIGDPSRRSVHCPSALPVSVSIVPPILRFFSVSRDGSVAVPSASDSVGVGAGPPAGAPAPPRFCPPAGLAWAALGWVTISFGMPHRVPPPSTNLSHLASAAE